ncbi:sensor domain-containing diguanylate cyclase [Motiliproteus coralliicola]|uniref:diguanylate cyclase n=1 Tax=Motiliproteus coralliicola TaxID=2283196 RepID=A0A369W7Y9_9GAMM|nr:diguanylate cyclase [Motiliproteus coralliicola]RDE18120.1 sensor domain-containing diguanylate cyclase [Motiliproteus coralliicola]
MNSIKIKLISSLFFTCLLLGAIVFLMTPHMIKHELTEDALKPTIRAYQQAIGQYQQTHPSWGTAEDAKRFALLAEARLDANSKPQTSHQIDSLVTDSNGYSLKPGPTHRAGDKISLDIFDDPEEIKINGRVVAYISPIDEIPLSASDKTYLHSVEETLQFSLLAAIAMILPFAAWKGSQITRSLNQLIEAVNKMAEGDLQQQVKINTRDEIGLLANAFNSMNTRLVNAYRELEESHQLIEQQAEQLKELSIRDELTGLYNRRFFNEEAKLLLSNASRYQQPLAAILADIDHFKMINDNFSHAVGDQVLQQVSEILLNGIRSSDLVARYGGEEMVFILPNTDQAKAIEMMDRIRLCIEEHPWHKTAPGLAVTMSFGICADNSVEQLQARLEQADQQLYRAKREGRNQVCINQ